MNTRNIIVIVVIILAAGALAYGGWLYFQNQTTTSSDEDTTPVVTENTNSATVSTTPITAGDIAVDKSFTAHDTLFTVETALQTDAFRRKQAGDGMTFVVLFLKSFDQAPLSDPLSWAGSEMRLTYGAAPSVVPTEISIPNRAGVSGGYLWFTVPDNARDFALVIGSGTAPTNIALGF